MRGTSNYPAYDDLLKLVPRGPRLWSVSAPLERMGVPLGRRVVVALGDGGAVALVSPYPLPPEIVREICALGRVRALLVPTLFHDTRLEQAIEPFEQAVIFAPEGFSPDRAGGRLVHPLEELDGPTFELQQVPIQGMPKVRESVFLHGPSQYLLVSDLLFHFPATTGLWAPIVLRLLGILGPPAVSRFFRLHIRDREAYRRSLRRIQRLAFSAVLPSHGAPIRDGSTARRALGIA